MGLELRLRREWVLVLVLVLERVSMLVLIFVFARYWVSVEAIVAWEVSLGLSLWRLWHWG